MKLAKKFISIFLSSACLCPSILAMKSSISVPEKLSGYASEESEPFDISLYALNKKCQHIIFNASDTPNTTIITDTIYICETTFQEISSLLCDKNELNKRYYASCLLNYVPLIEHLNYILLDIIPHKIKKTDPCFPVSSEIKQNVRNADSTISLTLAKYWDIFELELKATFMEPTKIQQIYDLLLETREGVQYISSLPSLLV